MKKKIFNNADFTKIRKAIKNSLDEEGANLRDALLSLITELEESEEEFSASDLEDALKAKFDEFKGKVEESQAEAVENAVAKAVAKRMADMAGAIKKELPVAIKNKVAGAILRSADKTQVENVVMKVLTENAITGFTFNDIIDFTIVEKWGDMNPLFKQLYKTMYTKFFYNTDTLLTAKGILAKQWGNAAVAEKVIQSLSVTGKQIETQYVYKRQQVAFADMDEIAQAGEESRFLAWISEELDRQIVNTIVMAILIGDTVNDANDRISKFETIGTKTQSDAFTSVDTAAASTPTISEVRIMCDKVRDPFGYGKVLIMSNSLLTTLSEFLFASGGTKSYRTKEEMAAQFGVREILTLDILEGSTTINAICMVPQEYWYKEKNYLNLVYPTYEKNTTNYQKERNIGGKIHGLLSTAVLKIPQG